MTKAAQLVIDASLPVASAMAMGFGAEGETSTAIANVATVSKVSSVAPWPPACLSILAVGTEEEKQYYE